MLQIDVGGPDFDDRAGEAVAQVIEQHHFDYTPELAEVLADVFIRGAMLGVADTAAILIEHGIADVRVNFDGVTFAE